MNLSMNVSNGDLAKEMNILNAPLQMSALDAKVDSVCKERFKGNSENMLQKLRKPKRKNDFSKPESNGNTSQGNLEQINRPNVFSAVKKTGRSRNMGAFKKNKEFFKIARKKISKKQQSQQKANVDQVSLDAPSIEKEKIYSSYAEYLHNQSDEEANRALQRELSIFIPK